MPQAPRILSESQILALVSCYLFLRPLPALLTTISFKGKVSPEERRRLDEHIRSAAIHKARLIALFPEVAKAAERLGDR
jgi:hypothetical protein